MAKKEIFQSILNKVLDDIRLDVMDCLANPPEKEVATYDLRDLEDKAIEYYERGDVGVSVYFRILFEMKSIEKDLKSDAKPEETEAKKAEEVEDQDD